MVYTDYLFFPLFLVVLLIYYATPLHNRWIVLLVSSLCFFCTWGIELLPFVFGSVFVSWMAACFIEREYVRQDIKLKHTDNWMAVEKMAFRQKIKKRCKHILLIAVTMVIGVLVYTKSQHLLANVPLLSSVVYFFSKVHQHIRRFFLLHVPVLKLFVKDMSVLENFTEFSFFVPLGISYYTMSLVGYIADVYWRKEQAEKNIFRLLLYALYFPKIVAGPIVKHRNIATQLNECHPFVYKRLCYGLQRMLWGYLKKMVIADRLNLLVAPVFENYRDYHGAVLLVAAICSLLYIFCDFSGCMDMALGASEAMGIKMEENFRRPFFSLSAAEYWRRWHITLGEWFKDYVYMPLAVSPRLIRISGKLRNKLGKRAGKAFMSMVPLLTVWFLTGLWHGTGWNYIVWGLYWGLLISISMVLEPEKKKLSRMLHINVESEIFKVCCMLRTFLLAVISRILTEPGSLSATAGILKK